MGFGQRQADHEGVGGDTGRQQHLPGQGNRHHKQRGEYQVGGEHPARQAQILGLDVFHHGHMKLTWQGDDGDHRQPRLGHHRRPVHGFCPEARQFSAGFSLAEQVAKTVVQTVSHKRADGEEGQQLDQ